MIVFLSLIWLAGVAGLVTLKVIPNKPASWLSTVLFAIFLTVFLFIPLQWSAPSGRALVIVNTVPIVPNVGGQVTEIAVRPNTPVKKGDVLFKIDPIPYQARLDALTSQLEFAELRVDQLERLGEGPAGRRFDLEEATATAQRLSAERTAALYDLEQTTVSAPADGFVTTVGLRPGERVATLPLAPAMTFVEATGQHVAAQVQQIYVRFIEPGQPVEIAFKTRPGEIFKGTVEAVINLNVEAQVPTSGMVIQPRQVQAVPFFVRIELDNPDDFRSLPGGSAGTIAIYTPQLGFAHVIRKVMLRMESFVNYLNPFL
ncbi:MAG: biotin/lipoyl-binding protein [Pseudomonadota bacterium]